jgi:N-acetylmuramoyl-L-alanine amidase
VPYQAEQKQEVNIPTIVPQEEQKKKEDKKEAEKKEDKIDIPVQTQPEPAIPEAVAETEVVKEAKDSTLIFKVQIVASSSKKKFSKKQLNGQPAAKYYEEGGFYKYTVGESADYDEIVKVREALVGNFPEAFIIAFRGDQKVDIRTAIREFRANKNKQ